jgi:hypothetical protein
MTRGPYDFRPRSRFDLLEIGKAIATSLIALALAAAIVVVAGQMLPLVFSVVAP